MGGMLDPKLEALMSPFLPSVSQCHPVEEAPFFGEYL